MTTSSNVRHNPVQQLLTEIEGLTGLPALFKNAQSGPGVPGIDARQYLHKEAFCQAVMKDKQRLGRCLSLYQKELFDEYITSDAKPFVVTCHAGARQLVVPLFSSGIFQGTLIIDPYRSGNTRTCTDCSEQFRSLPVCEGDKVFPYPVILHTLARFLVKTIKEAGTETQPNRKRAKILPVLNYIEKHFADKVSAEKAASLTGLSLSRFLHLFKECTGYPFSNYVLIFRIEEAKKLLMSPELRIGDAAFKAGFNSQSHFSRMFKRHTQLMPAEFRKKILSGVLP